VKFYNKRKGYGFIFGNSGVGDIFVHRDDLMLLAYLEQGDTVEFDTTPTPRGLHAINVRKVE